LTVRAYVIAVRACPIAVRACPIAVRACPIALRAWPIAVRAYVIAVKFTVVSRHRLKAPNLVGPPGSPALLHGGCDGGLVRPVRGLPR
jgi:hypothetical protein